MSVPSSPAPTGASEALRRARERVPEAADLLNALAQLAHRPFPLEAVRAASEGAAGDYRRAVAPGRAGDALEALAEEGVLRRSEAGVHVPEEVARALRDEWVRPVSASAAADARDFLEAWREQLESGPDEEDAWDRLADHAVALARRMAAAGRAPDDALRVGTRAAGRLQERTRPGEAEALLSELTAAAEEAEERLAEPFLLAALDDQRAGLLADAGSEEEAAAAARRSVERAEATCDPADPRRAVLLHNAGGVMKRIGRLEEATELYDRTYDLLDDHHEAGTPLELQLCLDLSDVLLAREEPGRAAEVAGRAVALARERLGRYHPETAAAVSNLGRAFRGEGRLEEARTAFEQALQILEEVYDGEHPALGPDLSNLGATLEEQGEVDRARELHCRAHGIFRDAFGADHHLTRAARAYLDDL